MGIVAKVQRAGLGRIGVWVAVAAMGLALAGCTRQRAELNIKKADSNISTARGWNADKYDDSKSAFEQAQSLVKQAKASVDGKQFPTALTQAQDAVKQSEQALTQARTRYADQRRTEARKAVEVATKNDGIKINQQLFDKAQEFLTKAEERLNKQKYEDAITNASQSIDAVDQLVAGLKNDSQNMLETLKSKQKELERQQADRFLPNALIKLKESIGQVEKKIGEERDYKQALILAKAASTDADANIVETKKRNSQLQLQTLESKIAEAISEEAPIYAPDQLKTAQESFEEILKNFYENQFDTVLEGSTRLQPKVDQLITITRIEATKDKILTVNRGIANLKEQSVEQYLPGRVKVMEDLAGEAQDLFNNSDYNGAKEKANQALVEQDRIIAAFDALAEKTIADGEAAYNAARGTYDKMLTFFSGAARNLAIDQRIEARRQSESSRLAAQRDSALDRMNSSKSNRSQRQFKKSIEQAKEVRAISDTVTNGTFKIVAEHALLSIQDEVSQLERMGARQEAPRQLEQVQSLVEQTQKLIRENQNREAAEYTAKARAYLENVKQELARRAVEEKGRADELIRRLEGGAAPATAAGGREFPGGSDLNNKEAMLDEVAAIRSRADEPRVLAQTYAAPNSTHPGGTGASGLLPNRQAGGTFMTSDNPGRYSRAELNTGAPTGALIGTRPEPVVPTHENTRSSYTGASYEGPTAPGPFVATTGGAAAASATGGMSAPESGNSLAGIRQQVSEILLDDARVRDIQRFQPQAIDEARAKLKESSDALAAQDYMKALDAAKESQRIVLEAEMKAARMAAKQNLRAAADRINLAEASGAVMFAPAQLTEAIKLYEQSESFLATGQNLLARDASERAMIAADDARLYNVNKARDLALLSTRYGGWKAVHPPLVAAEQKAAIAADLLANPATAAQGQELAKQAVVCAQIALDQARDYSFQERLDNIYKALNTALRAGANYFNVSEIKRLIAELSVARDEYNSRNFDAVELKLKDIEARLARVIETTPLVLQENLTDLTEKLNALVEAGAENYMAQEVDDVKTLMNRSAIDFRKHDYYSSYSNLKNAMKLVDAIELRLQEQVYFDAVTELFAQLDEAFKDFAVVLNYDPVFLKKLVATPNGQPGSISYAGKASPNLFKDRINDIYLRAIHLKPPKSQEGTHQELIVAIKFARSASENFQKLYMLDQVSKPDAYQIIDTAYAQIGKSKLMRGELQVKLIDPQARTKLISAEKIVNY